MTLGGGEGSAKGLTAGTPAPPLAGGSGTLSAEICTGSNCSHKRLVRALHLFVCTCLGPRRHLAHTQGDLTHHVYPCVKLQHQSHLRLDSPTHATHASFFVFALGAWNRSRFHFAQRNSQQEFILHLFTCLGLIISTLQQDNSIKCPPQPVRLCLRCLPVQILAGSAVCSFASNFDIHMSMCDVQKAPTESVT